MKTKTILIFSFTGIFLLGFVCGNLTTAISWVKQNNRNIYQNYANDVSTYVHALNSFRHGDQQGCANILENSLETSLLAMNNSYETLTAQPDNSIYQTIKDARIYRTKYSWGNANAKMSPEVEKTIETGVNHVLSLGM